MKGFNTPKRHEVFHKSPFESLYKSKGTKPKKDKKKINVRYMEI